MLINWEFKVLGGIAILGAVFGYGYLRGKDSGAAKIADLTAKNVQFIQALSMCQNNRDMLNSQIDSLNTVIEKMGEESARYREYQMDQLRKAKDREAVLKKILEEELNKPMPEDKTQWVRELAKSINRQMGGIPDAAHDTR